MRTIPWWMPVFLGLAACSDPGGDAGPAADVLADQTAPDSAGDADGDAGGAGDTPGPDVSTGACGNAPGQLFPPGAPWNTRVDGAPADPQSDAIIGYLAANHDTGTRFQIDFSIEVLRADASTPKQAFTPTGDHYSPDCDTAPIPVPAGGAIEGEAGYECASDGDCHLIVISEDECRLYEQWRANISGGTFAGGCLAVWDLDRVYPPDGRGEHCTSADAAGLPIAPLLFTAEEVAAGEIPHAIRFILPNARIRDRVYVRPATHSTGATSGPDDAPPYGVRLRLRDDVDTGGFSEPARVVLTALQRYGMILADAGNLTFTAKSSRFDAVSWDDAGLGPHDLKALTWDDFEVVEMSETHTWTGDCERDPITD